MTASLAESPSPQHYPNAEVVEKILGTSLFVPDNDQVPPEGRRHIGEATYKHLVNMIMYHSGVNIADPEISPALSDEDLTLLSTQEDTRFLAREITIANAMQRNSHVLHDLPEGADDPDTPRAKEQSVILKEIISHYQSLPDDLDYDPETPLSKRLRDGLAMVAATGIGKTVVAAQVMRLLGIGSVEKDGAVVERATLATSTRKLVRQFLGESGNNTFRQFLGDVPVTPVYSAKRDQSGKIRITTTKSFTNIDDIGFLTVDEGHSVLGAQTFKNIAALGLRELLLTATPAYSKERDLSNFYRTVVTKTLRQLVEGDILNPTRLLTFEYEDNPVVTAAELAYKYIQIGRKVAIYCEAGDSSKQSQDIAAYVNALHRKRHGENAKDVMKSVGSHEPKSDDYEQALDDGDLGGLATCRRLREGWDSDVDVGIFINPSSVLDLTQKMGRFMRPGKFVTELVELFPKGKRHKASIWSIMEMEEVDPDRIIGYTEPRDYYGPRSPRHQQSPDVADTPDVLSLDDLPLFVKTSLLQRQPLKTASIGISEFATPQSGTAELGSLATQHNVPYKWLQAQLDKAGLAYDLIPVDPTEPNTKYQRWYYVEDYFEQNYIPELARMTEKRISEIARLCNTTVNHIDSVIKELGIRPISRLSRGKHQHKREPHFDIEALAEICNYVDEYTPIADESEMPLGILRRRWGNQFVNNFIAEHNIQTPSKRRNPVHGAKGISPHASAADSLKIEEAAKSFRSIPIIDPTIHQHITAVAKAARMSLNSLLRNLTEDEEAAIRSMRKNQRAIPGRYVHADIAEQIIERLQPKKILPHMVPIEVYGSYLANRAGAMINLRRQSTTLPGVRYEIDGKIRDAHYMTWGVLRELEKGYGRHRNAKQIDFDRVVRDEFDADPERVAYTQEIQSMYLPEEVLGQPDSVESTNDASSLNSPAENTDMDEAARPVPAASSDRPNIADHHTDSTTAENRMTHSMPLAPATEAAIEARKPLRDTSDLKKSGKKGQGEGVRRPIKTIDANAYLAEKDLASDPRVVALIVKSNGWWSETDEKGKLIIPEICGTLLATSITDIKQARHDMHTAEYIIRQFSDVTLHPKDIHRVAQSIYTPKILRGHCGIRRAKIKNEAWGGAYMHYDVALSELIIQKIRILINKRRLHNLLQG